MKSWSKFTLLVVTVAFLPILMLTEVSASRESVRSASQPKDRLQSDTAVGSAVSPRLKDLSLEAKFNLDSPSMQRWAEQLDSLSIQPDGVFSLYHWATDVVSSHGLNPDDETLERIGSALLYTAVQAGLEVGVHASHKQLPASLEPGFDLDFRYGEQDFMIFNPHTFAVKGALDTIGTQARFKLQGSTSASWTPAEIAVQSEVFEPERIRLEDHAEGAQARTVQGRPGQLVKVYGMAGGERQLLYKHYYAPQASLVYETLPPASTAVDSGGDS